MNINKILKAASVFMKSAQEKIEQKTLEDVLYQNNLAPWASPPSQQGAPEIKYDAPFFTKFVNPALDAMPAGTKVTVKVNPDGRVVTIPASFASKPTMMDYSKRVKPLAVPGSAPATLIVNYG